MSATDNPAKPQFWCAGNEPMMEFKNEREWHDHIRLVHPEIGEAASAEFKRQPTLADYFRD